MQLNLLYLDLLSTPPSVWISKMWERFFQAFGLLFLRKKDSIKPSFLKSSAFSFNHRTQRFLDPTSFELKPETIELLQHYQVLCLEHKFDLLGSGWMKWNYQKSDVKGHDSFSFDKEGGWLKSVVNQSNFSESKRIWKTIQSISTEYEPIDWQREVKSGHRFSAQTWFRDPLKPFDTEHTDIKVPWELSRMQHLIRMILIAMRDVTLKEKLGKEVQCQILDFIMANPPRWGVNWRSTMDVAIRSANLAFALDLLIQNDMIMPEAQTIILKSLEEHVQFIEKYHEKKSGLGNNHYLSNIVGVLCTTTVLESDNWRKVNLQHYSKELVKEILKQFLKDGGNFESSTSYHCLSLEMAIYGIWVIDFYMSQGVTFSESYQKQLTECKIRLEKAADLLEHMIHPDGTIPQFGDNDSARFLKTSFFGKTSTMLQAKKMYLNLKSEGDTEELYLDENLLDYTECKRLCDAMMGGQGNSIVSSKFANTNDQNKDAIAKSEPLLYRSNRVVENLSFQKTMDYHPRVDGPDLTAELSTHFFSDVGYYIFKGKQFHMAINGSNRKVKQYWPHGHNDKLGFDLYFGNEPIFRDPGSFVYTGNPIERNKYRSEEAHNVPIHRLRQNIWPDGRKGVFRTINKSKVELLESSENHLKLLLKIGPINHIREWRIQKECITVLDQSNEDFILNEPKILFSPGYGKKLTATV